MRGMRLGLLGVVLLLAFAVSAFAQTYQGGLRGAVRDPGGVVPGVEVTLINDQTSVWRATVTNAQREYTFANVLPGTYAVKASLTDFKTVEQTGVRIGTQQFIVLDLTLEVGSVSEESSFPRMVQLLFRVNWQAARRAAPTYATEERS